MRNCETTFVFLVGVIAGLVLLGVLIYIHPRGLAAVNNELLEANLAHRDWKTGLIIWNDVNNTESNCKR